jgi:hypothetical protein
MQPRGAGAGGLPGGGGVGARDHADAATGHFSWHGQTAVHARGQARAAQLQQGGGGQGPQAEFGATVQARPRPPLQPFPAVPPGAAGAQPPPGQPATPAPAGGGAQFLLDRAEGRHPSPAPRFGAAPLPASPPRSGGLQPTASG